MTEFSWQPPTSPSSHRGAEFPDSATGGAPSIDHTMRFGGISIDRVDVEGTRYVTVVGELDLSNVDELRKALESDGKAIHLDTTRLTFIDSTGLSVITQAREELGADRFELVPGTATIRILEITKLDRLFG